MSQFDEPRTKLVDISESIRTWLPRSPPNFISPEIVLPDCSGGTRYTLGAVKLVLKPPKTLSKIEVFIKCLYNHASECSLLFIALPMQVIAFVHLTLILREKSK